MNYWDLLIEKIIPILAAVCLALAVALLIKLILI